MRPVSLGFALLLATAALCASGGDNDLVHDWQQENTPGGIRFVSKHKAPFPFSQTGEPEAVLVMQLTNIRPGVSLDSVMKGQIDGIRNETEIGDYLEKDHQPDRGIVSFVEEINGHKVGFVKYRIVGLKGQGRVAPRSATLAIVLKQGELYFLHLFVLYAGHQEEVRGDQVRLIKTILAN